MECKDEKTDVVYIRGCFVQSVAIGSIEIYLDAIIAFEKSTGLILQFEPHAIDSDHLIKLVDIVLPSHQFFVPGFIDTHIHAPQYSYTGTATDKPLMQWLHQYTFPVEQSFEDLTVAEQGYSAVIRRALEEGITTAMYFATIHLPASKLFADLLEKYGQRGFVGMVQMDFAG